MNQRFEKFLDRHKVVKIVYTSITLAVLGLLIAIALSWDSLLGLAIFRDRAALCEFVYEVGLVIAFIIISIIIAVWIGRKR